MIGLENYNSINILLFVIFIFFLLCISLSKPQFYKNSFKQDDLIVIPQVFLGAVITYGIQYFLEINMILAAGIVGFISTLMESKNKYIKSLPIYCGVFVGMTSPQNNYDFYLITVMGLFAGIIYYISKNFYIGIGGKLGTIAFTSVMIGILIIKFYINDFSS